MTSHAFADHQPAPLPVDETARIAALGSCAILDTPPDESFDRLTRLATLLTGAAIAIVTLVDEERQWFKSTHGLPARTTQTSRDLSFCAHTILSDDVLVVPDATLDTRFAYNPLVTGSPCIRFYAGAPLITAEGQRIGAFCIIDTHPRLRLHEKDRRILIDFAAIALELIESRIDQRKRQAAEEAVRLKASEMERQMSLFQQTMDTISQGVSVFDSHQRLTMANRAFEQLYGIPEGLARKGSKLEDHIRFQLAATGFDGEMEGEIARILAIIETPEGCVFHVNNAEGRILEIRIHRVQGGGLVSTHTDVTEMRMTERTLRQQERMKDEFISTVSHELRTPLASIAGALGVLGCGGGGELPAKAARLVAIAESNCDRLTRLVADVLDIERMALGKFQLHKTPTDLAALIAEAIQTLEPFAQHHEARLFYDGPEVLPSTIVADHDRMMQVLTNLLSNAAKFSPQNGEVRVSMAMIDDFVRIEVADNGPGIPEDFRSRVFEKFSQADRSDTRKSGTGLGLSIAKMIVETHGGRIGFESEPGVRTVFWFELPA